MAHTGLIRNGGFPRMAKATALVKSEESKAVSVEDEFDPLDQYAGVGTENITAKDLIIPRVTILQGLSPQLNKSKAEYIKGAEAGLICDVARGQVFGEEIVFLPCYFNRRWLEWYPRSSGKGLAAIHDTDEVLDQCTQDEKGRWFTASGNSIQEAAQFFGLNMSADRRKCFIPMSGTQLKKARRLLSYVADFKTKSGKPAPIFYASYKLGVVPENNNEGDWLGWKVELDKKLSEYENPLKLMQECADFAKALSTGAARADDSGLSEAVATQDEGDL